MATLNMLCVMFYKFEVPPLFYSLAYIQFTLVPPLFFLYCPVTHSVFYSCLLWPSFRLASVYLIYTLRICFSLFHFIHSSYSKSLNEVTEVPNLFSFIFEKLPARCVHTVYIIYIQYIVYFSLNDLVKINCVIYIIYKQYMYGGKT